MHVEIKVSELRRKLRSLYIVLVYLSLAYRTKRYLKYQNIHILLFHLRAIFSEPGSINYNVYRMLPVQVLKIT